MNEEKMIYYVPPIRDFKDTGFVKHSFGNGGFILSRVVPSDDGHGFAIDLQIKDDSGNELCHITMGRFAALCLAEALMKNLMDQEELVELQYYTKEEKKES